MSRVLLAAVIIGMAVSPSASQPTADWSNAIDLTIELNDFNISPDALILYEGQPYRLHFVNTSARSHNFTANRFFGAATIAPWDVEFMREGQIELDEGESATIHLIAPAADEFGARCTHLFHGPMGQTADIEVRPMPALSGAGL